MTSCLTLLKLWEQRFSDQALDSPKLSAQLLLAHILGMSRMDLLLDVHLELEPPYQEQFEVLARRRLKGEPVAYLTGTREFYGLDFFVNPAVLIPRPETELLVDYLRQYCEHDFKGTILDIGTGCGTLAVTCAHYFPKAKILASDLSWAALQVARKNALAHGVHTRILFSQGDLAQHISCEHVEIILANLPYVPESRKETLSHEVAAYEPQSALFSGEDGLDAYRQLASILQNRMVRGSLLLCEIDMSQGAAIKQLFHKFSQEVRVLKDYSSLERMAVVVF